MSPFFAHKISLGQNFLRNSHVLSASLSAGALTSDDTVLEIGSGQGALTARLLESPAACVHAMEIDERLRPWLEPLAEQSAGRCRLHWGDALKFDFSTLSPLPNKIIANIPYSITSELIWKILAEAVPSGVQKIVLLIQKEAAERLNAPLRTKKRGPLGVTLELMGKMRFLMNVPPHCFIPAPKVWSTLLCIDICDNRFLASDGRWRTFITSAFARRRKKLLNVLPAAPLPRKNQERLFGALNLSLSARAEELTALQWLQLYRLTARELR